MNAYSNIIGENGKCTKKPYDESEIDFLIGFNPDTKDFFVIPIQDLTVQHIRVKKILKHSHGKDPFKIYNYKERFDLIKMRQFSIA